MIDTTQHGCMENCTYKKTLGSDSGHYCFKHGILPVTESECVYNGTDTTGQDTTLLLLPEPHNATTDGSKITSYRGGHKVEKGPSGSCCYTVSIGFTIEFDCEIRMKGIQNTTFAETVDSFASSFKTQYREQYQKEASQVEAASSASFWGFFFGISASGVYTESEETTNLYKDGKEGLETTREGVVDRLSQLTGTFISGTIKGKATGLLPTPQKSCLVIKLSQIKIETEGVTKTLQVVNDDALLANPNTGRTDGVKTEITSINLIE